MFRLLSAFALAAVPMVLWGIQPQSLAQLAGFNELLTMSDLLGQLNVAALAGIVLSLLLAVALAWMLRQPRQQMALLEQWRPLLATITGLSWVLAAMQWLSAWLDSVGRVVVSVFEGEGYFGWLVLIILLAWLVMQP